jgi:hypothetical protein
VFHTYSFEKNTKEPALPSDAEASIREESPCRLRSGMTNDALSLTSQAQFSGKRWEAS